MSQLRQVSGITALRRSQRRAWVKGTVSTRLKRWRRGGGGAVERGARPSAKLSAATCGAAVVAPPGSELAPAAVAARLLAGTCSSTTVPAKRWSTRCQCRACSPSSRAPNSDGRCETLAIQTPSMHESGGHALMVSCGTSPRLRLTRSTVNRGVAAPPSAMAVGSSGPPLFIFKPRTVFVTGDGSWQVFDTMEKSEPMATRGADRCGRGGTK